MIYLKSDATEKEVNLKVVFPLKFMLKSSKNGIDVIIKEHQTNRTNAQNAFYWQNLTEIKDVLNGAGCTYGEYALPYTTEILHEICKMKFGIKSTARLSKKEFCDYMEQIFQFWIEKTAGVFSPLETAESYLERTGLLEG